MSFSNIEMEINASFKKAIQKKGVLNFIKSLFGDKTVTEEIAREIVNNLKENGLAEEAKKYLQENANSFFEESIDGIRFLDYLPENITLDGNNIFWYNDKPVAIVNHNIIPIKGQKEKLKEALQEIQKIRAKVEEDEVYFKSLKFGKERAEADRIAYRLGKFFDSIEGKKDFISRILENLDSLPEFDFEKEKESRRIEKELRENEIKVKILEELPYVKIENKKVLRTFPKQHVTLNPGYEEFFHNHLGDYSRDEIYSALKDLEKELVYNKEKVKALRKEFEKREGISRRKKLALLTAGVIAVIPATYALKTYLEHQRSSTSLSTTQTTTSIQPPQPKVYSVDYPSQISTNSNLQIKISADADKVLVQLNENGISKNITASYSDKLFYASIPVKEGFYGIEKVYAFKDGNVLVKDINTVLKALDNPIIHTVQYERNLSPGKEAIIKVNASDTSGIKEAIMIVNAPDKQFQINASQENGFYVFRFPLEKEPSYSFKIILKDPFNQSSKYEGSISSLDNPVIHSFSINKIIEKGIVQVLVNASDTSDIAKALIEINGNNYTMEKVNGLYAYNITFGENPASSKIKVYVIDNFNQSSSATSEIEWLLQDAFKYYSFKNGIDVSQSEKFYSHYKDLVNSYYLVKREDLLPALYIFNKNATLLATTKEKIYNDPNVTDKAKTLLQLSKALYDLNEKSLSDTSLNYLGNLTVVEGNPVSTFGRLALWNVLNLTESNPIIVTGLSKQQPIVYGETPILVYIVNDNLNDSKEFPYAAWALTKQASAIAKWLRIDYNQYLTVNGTEYRLREIVNKDFSILANYTRNGKMVLGLKPEELLALIPSDHPNKYVIADNWMRQKVLPQSLFYNVWQESVLGWEKYPDFMPHTNGPFSPIFKVYRPEIALKIATDNLNYFDQGHNSVVDVIKNPDKPLPDGWSAKKWIRNYVEMLLRTYFPNTQREAEEDINLLLDKGSNIAKINLYIYGKSLSDHVLGTVYVRPRPDEQRNDQSILNAYSIGLPQFISETFYPLNTDRAHWAHGEPSFIILPSDISLLYQRSPDELLLNDKTYTLNFLSTRKPAIIKDKVPFCDVYLPDLTVYVYYKS